MRLAVILLTVVMAAEGDPTTPRTEITPILHTGDPAPGIDGETISFLLAPLIDGEGNVLVPGFFTGGRGAWYGPPGGLVPIAYAGMQAPDLPEGVVFTNICCEALSETGVIGFRGELTGPGIIGGVNDLAGFAGPAGDIRKVLQGGEQAPGLPGVVIDAGPGFGLGASLSDNATVRTKLWLTGDGVDESNDEGIWIGPRDNLRLVWRKGMEAPGTEPGVTFDWSDLLVFNDTQIAFRGSLVGDSIDKSNDRGRWIGGPQDLVLVARDGDAAPGFPPEVTFTVATGGLTTLNAHGDTTVLGLIEGPGIDEENNLILYVGQPGDLDILRREGDPAPEAGPDVEIGNLGNQFMNNQREIIYLATFRGPPINDGNISGVYFGPFDGPKLELRDGEPAPNLDSGVTLAAVGGALSITAMNDLGDVVTGTEIAGDDVGDEDDIVVWFRDRIRDQWFPLLRSGTTIDSRTVFIPDLNDLSPAYRNKTGGSDGAPQSLNDQGVFAMKIPFMDETHGVFLLRLVWAGDNDGDGDVDFADLGEFQLCFTGSKGGVSEGCTTFDFDDDEDVDLFDLECFLGATTGPH